MNAVATVDRIGLRADAVAELCRAAMDLTGDETTLSLIAQSVDRAHYDAFEGSEHHFPAADDHRDFWVKTVRLLGYPGVVELKLFLADEPEVEVQS